MTEEVLPKGQTVETPKKDEKQADQPKLISVEEILGGYPLDRDKCRDVILLELSRNIGRIAQTLEAISQGLIVTNTRLEESNNLKKQGK